jgi:carboxymethylenebutenolidase
VLTETAELQVADRTVMGAYVARPAAHSPSAGVVVGMELFGVSAHVRDVCERLAACGYLALAPDLYHRSAPWVELAHDDAGRERGFALLAQTTRSGALADVQAAIGYLHGRGCAAIGMIGLSVGGHLAYLAATQLELDAVAVLYGGWIPTTDIPLSQPEPTLALTGGIRGRMLLLVGDQDKVVPPEHRRAIGDALSGAGVRHELIEYPGVPHGFLCDRRESYDPAAAEDAWARVEQLFADELHAGGLD